MSTGSRSFSPPGHAGRFLRPVVAAALCSAFVVASPVPARAQTATDADAVADIVEWSGEHPVPSPGRTHGDITSTRLTHGANSVRIRVEYADLQKVGFTGLSVDVVTNEGVRRHVYLDSIDGHRSGATEMLNTRYDWVQCAISHRIDYSGNVMTIGFPRRCASNPRWIRLGVGVIASDAENTYWDDALRDRAINETDRIWALSGRLSRDAG